MKKQILLALFFLVNLTFAQQLTKVYILSEGGFSAGTSSLSVLDLATNNFSSELYINSVLGSYPDGLFISDTTLYLSEQGSFGGAGKIYKLDSNGNIIAESNPVGTNPFALTVVNEKVYTTNGPASSVSVLNASDLSYIKDISVGAYPQEIISNNEYVFVANNSIWGGASDSTVSVIDVNNDEVIDTIIVKLNPSSLALTNNGYLLVGCPGDESNGIIYKISLTNFAKVDSFTVPSYGFGNSLVVDNDSNRVFFKSAGNDIIKLDMQNKETTRVVEPTEAIYIYGYNYDIENQIHYLLDAKDFSANGSLLTYNSAGTLLSTYETSVAPRRVEFMYYPNPTNLKSELLVNKFTLEQNYPNPFNPTTNINFTLPKRSEISLKVFNILGEEVKSLVNEFREAGIYSITFDANNLSSGVYFYTLKTGDFSQTKKMILMR